MLNCNQILSGSPEAQALQTRTENYMKLALQSDATLSTLLPSFTVGCRRVTPGDGYLKALTASNVAVISEAVEICNRGIKLNTGEVIHLDAIVCATGFDCSFVPRFPLIGDNGNLQDLWKNKTPKAYMSCMIEGMPNYFSKATQTTNITRNIF